MASPVVGGMEVAHRREGADLLEVGAGYTAVFILLPA